MNKAQDIIKDFFLKTELEDFVANLLFEEFLKPGLILLPSGNTFEESIYPKVNDFFAETQFQAFNVATQETKTKEIKKQVHPKLKLSHLDELVTENNSKPFAEAIQTKLFNICQNNFTEIDTRRLEDFDEFLKVMDQELLSLVLDKMLKMHILLSLVKNLSIARPAKSI